MNDKNYNELLSQLSRQLGVSSDKLSGAVNGGNLGNVLKDSDNAGVKRAEEILSSPEKTKQVLSSPEAQALLRLLEEEQ